MNNKRCQVTQMSREEANMRKVLKITLSLFLVMSMMFSLAGCGEIKKAEKVVNETFTALKARDYDKAQNYIDVDNIMENDSEEDIEAEVFMNNIFEKLEYEIISSEKVDGNTVNVKTKITAIDMKPVLREYIAAAFQYVFSTAFSNPQPTEEETNKKMEEILVECISKPDLATVTNEVIIKVVKEDKNWKIASDDTVADALLGGMISAAEELNNSVGGLSGN